MDTPKNKKLTNARYAISFSELLGILGSVMIIVILLLPLTRVTLVTSGANAPPDTNIKQLHFVPLDSRSRIGRKN